MNFECSSKEPMYHIQNPMYVLVCLFVCVCGVCLMQTSVDIKLFRHFAKLQFNGNLKKTEKLNK